MRTSTSLVSQELVPLKVAGQSGHRKLKSRLERRFDREAGENEKPRRALTQRQRSIHESPRERADIGG